MEPGKFGPFLRALRTRRGLTQEQLARRLHVSGAAVSKWETGKCLPDLTKLEALAEVLDVGILELMRCGGAVGEPSSGGRPRSPPRKGGTAADPRGGRSAPVHDPDGFLSVFSPSPGGPGLAAQLV